MSPFINKTQTDLAPDFEKFMKMCEDLHENVWKCIQDLNGQETQMNLFQTPLGVNVENVNGTDFWDV